MVIFFNEKMFFVQKKKLIMLSNFFYLCFIYLFIFPLISIYRFLQTKLMYSKIKLKKKKKLKELNRLTLLCPWCRISLKQFSTIKRKYKIFMFLLNSKIV